MNHENPIFTQQTACQDCYKCIRECPVKAIKVQGGYASVVSDLCILCGHCVDVCPHGAKQVRDDVPRARKLLAEKAQVILSLAPSFVTEFPDIPVPHLIAALRALGFAQVSETALGAEAVSAEIARGMAMGKAGVSISTACPTAVAYFQKYAPEEAPFLSPVLSPLLTHAALLRHSRGPDTGIVFAGPCVAKKMEADQHPDLVDVALTFEDLRHWMEEEAIDPLALTPGEADRFTPRRSREGGLYPVEGGMNESIRRQAPGLVGHFLSYSGLPALGEALQGLRDFPVDRGIFLELLACPGGCVNGPKSSSRVGSACKRIRVEAYARPAIPEEPPGPPLFKAYPARPVDLPAFGEDLVRQALLQVGKREKKDELNCGGCGYDSCRDFARALLGGRAEPTMCVANMRLLAQKKANILIQKMPSAVVIVDTDLRVVESNPVFRRLFKPSGIAAGEDGEWEGRPLGDLVPFTALFESVMARGEDLLERDLRHRGLILHTLLFTIERGRLVGAVFEDITQPANQREQVIKRAQQVISQNLKTVQEIAFLIGENAADSEITLNSIVASFQPEGEAP